MRYACVVWNCVGISCGFPRLYFFTSAAVTTVFGFASKKEEPKESLGARCQDIDQLRATSLREDLQKLVTGAPLLRQDRTVISQIFYYKREIWRMLDWALANLDKAEAVAALGACIGVLSVLLLGLALIIITLRGGSEGGSPHSPEKKNK